VKFGIFQTKFPLQNLLLCFINFSLEQMLSSSICLRKVSSLIVSSNMRWLRSTVLSLTSFNSWVLEASLLLLLTEEERWSWCLWASEEMSSLFFGSNLETPGLSSSGHRAVAPATSVSCSSLIWCVEKKT